MTQEEHDEVCRFPLSELLSQAIPESPATPSPSSQSQSPAHSLIDDETGPETEATVTTQLPAAPANGGDPIPLPESTPIISSQDSIVQPWRDIYAQLTSLQDINWHKPIRYFSSRKKQHMLAIIH